MAVETSRLVIEIDARNAEKQAQALNEELINITNSGNKADKQVGVLGTSLKTLAGYMAGIVTVSSAIEKIDAYSGMNNRLKLVTNSQKDLNKAMNDTFAIAQKSYQSWDSVIQIYQRFSDNAKALGINMEQTARLTETVSKAVAISGSSAQASEAALVQFSQALSSGTLRGEELNSVMEQTPALAKAIAQGMGITVGQLRSVAAEGKITSDVLVKALTKVSSSVDEQFAKTDMTIGQSIQLMNNELTKFVGEAGKSSGAATGLAEAIKTLSLNLNLIADASVVAGVGYLTKAILTKTTAVYADVAATVAQKAATQAQLQSELALATAQVNSAKAHLASIQATNADAQAKFGATAANARYVLATNAVTAAVAKQTAAQIAMTGSATLASRAMMLVGGPIGAITLGVSALASGYIYMQGKTADATAKLEEQAKVANNTREELLKLQGVEKSSAINDMTVAFEAQNKELRKSELAMGSALIAIQNYAKGNENVTQISNQARLGTISYREAIERLNKENIPPDLYNALKKQAEQYDENYSKANTSAKGLKVFGIEVQLAGNKAQNAVNGINANSNALDDNASAARNASQAQQAFINSAMQAGKQARITNTLLAKGFSPENAKDFAEVAAKNGKVTAQEAQAIMFKNAEISKLNKTLEAQRQAETNASKARRSANSNALKEERQANRERERLDKESADLRVQIQYSSADRVKKIELDLQNQISEINRARFSPDDTKNYVEVAKNRAELEKQIFIAEQEFEINEFQFTEKEKLDFQYKINKLRLQANADLDEDLFNGHALKLEESYKIESAQLKLASEERIFQAQQAYMAEEEFIKKRYDLERRAILENSKLQADERKAQLEALDLDTIRGGVRRSTGNTTDKNSQFFKNFNYAPMLKNNQQLLDDDYKKTLEKMEANFQIIQDKNTGNHDALLQAEREFLEAKAQLQSEYDFKLDVARQKDYESQLSMYGSILSMTSGVFNELTGMVQDYAGENSKSYKTMFAIQKAMAIAQGIVSTELAATQVMADPTALTLAQKQLYAGIIRATGYASVGIIAGQMIAGPQGRGYKNGGYTGNYGVNDVAGVVHGQEYVMDAKTTSRVGTDTLDAIRSGQPVALNGATQQSNINVPVTIVNQFDDGTIAESMVSDVGQNATVNNIKRNRTKIMTILGI